MTPLCLSYVLKQDSDVTHYACVPAFCHAVLSQQLKKRVVCMTYLHEDLESGMFSCSAICISEVSLGAHMLLRLRVSKSQMLQQAPGWHFIMIGSSVANIASR